VYLNPVHGNISNIIQSINYVKIIHIMKLKQHYEASVKRINKELLKIKMF